MNIRNSAVQAFNKSYGDNPIEVSKYFSCIKRPKGGYAVTLNNRSPKEEFVVSRNSYEQETLFKAPAEVEELSQYNSFNEPEPNKKEEPKGFSVSIANQISPEVAQALSAIDKKEKVEIKVAKKEKAPKPKIVEPVKDIYTGPVLRVRRKILRSRNYVVIHVKEEIEDIIKAPPVIKKTFHTSPGNRSNNGKDFMEYLSKHLLDIWKEHNVNDRLKVSTVFNLTKLPKYIRNFYHFFKSYGLSLESRLDYDTYRKIADRYSHTKEGYSFGFWMELVNTWKKNADKVKAA